MKHETRPFRPSSLGLVPAAAVLASALTGCGLFSQDTDYARVPEGRPLEVPPDLDPPEASSAMAVPNTTYSRVQGGPVSPSSRASGQEPVEGVMRVGGELALVLADAPEDTFRRLGYALERSGLEVTERDEADRTFVVDYEDVEAKEQRPGAFSRWILRRKGPPDYSGRYRIGVVPQGGTSMITVRPEAGGTAAERPAREMLEALEQRLS